MLRRRPVQCEGIERGPERTAQVGTTGSVQPQFLGGVASTLAPIAIDAALGYLNR